jgi:hypothetical protein
MSASARERLALAAKRGLEKPARLTGAQRPQPIDLAYMASLRDRSQTLGETAPDTINVLRMKRLSSIAAVLTIPFCLFSQTGIKPVPQKWLHKGRLLLPEFNFSITSPSPNAKWSYKDDLPKVDGKGSTAFFVDTGDGSKYVVMVLENSSKMESTSPDQFITGMRKTLPKDWQIRDTRFEASDVPLKDSRYFKVTIGLPNASLYYAYGYIVSGNRSYQIVTFSPSANEPVPFTQFAHSFALLDASANTPPPNFSSIFLLWAIWGAVVDWKYVRRGGARATRSDRLCGLAAVGLGAALLVFLGVRGASAESLGSITALVGTLVFSLWEFARWRVRRKNPLPIPGS